MNTNCYTTLLRHTMIWLDRTQKVRGLRPLLLERDESSLIDYGDSEVDKYIHFVLDGRHTHTHTPLTHHSHIFLVSIFFIDFCTFCFDCPSLCFCLSHSLSFKHIYMSFLSPAGFRFSMPTSHLFM